MSGARFVTYEELHKRFFGKKVAIICSGPGCLDNTAKFIESHDVVVRVQNYSLEGRQDKLGSRTDVHYSFYGGSVKKPKEALIKEGVQVCMAKCPDADCGGPGDFMESKWHQEHNKPEGVDYRYIYKRRASWWFCDTYIPTKDRFKSYFKLINHHQPTTGFACILDFMSFECDIYLTGYDGFKSGIHNINEPWHEKNTTDPFCHAPWLELQYLKAYQGPIKFDKRLSHIIGTT